MKVSGIKMVGVVLGWHVCLLWPATAFAQLTAPREAAQIELGPLSLYPTIQVVDAGKDDNVFNENRSPKPDYTFTLASSVMAVMRLASNELMASIGSDYVWFREYASERSSNVNYALRFNLSASRFKPFIGAARTRTNARRNQEIDARADRVERSAIVGSNFNVTPRTALTMSARFDETTYQEGERFRGVPLDDSLNRSGRLYEGGVRYAVTPLTTLTLTGNYGEDTFPESHVRDARRYSLTPLLEFSPDAAIRGSISWGYEIFKPLNPEFPENRGFVVDGAINFSTSSQTTFDLQVIRNVSYSYQDNQPYYLQTGARLTVTQRLFWTLEAVATGDRQVLSYRWRAGVLPAPDTVFDDDTADTVALGLGIPLRRGFRILVGVERTTRRSPGQPGKNYRRQRVLSTVTFGR